MSCFSARERDSFLNPRGSRALIASCRPWAVRAGPVAVTGSLDNARCFAWIGALGPTHQPVRHYQLN